MNPMNFIMNYLIANSRANHYNLQEKQMLQTTALLTGMVVNNPMMSYLLIENQAKNAQVVPVPVEQKELPKPKLESNSPKTEKEIIQQLQELHKRNELSMKRMEEIASKIVGKEEIGIIVEEKIKIFAEKFFSDRAEINNSDSVTTEKPKPVKPEAKPVK